MKRLLGIVLLVWMQLATAGTACEGKKVSQVAFVKAITLAEHTVKALDASGAQVALIARVGQDLSKYGLRYSHMAYVLRDHPKGRWIVVHELNQCGTANSALYDQGLANFFLDDLFAYESALLIPSPESQARIVRMLVPSPASEARIVRAFGSPAPLRLHDGHYNMLAYAFSTQYQNSNQWVLETYAASSSELPLRDREAAQAWLKLAGYQPSTVHIPASTRLGARLFKANISFDDHPFARRMAGQIDTVTVESVLRFVSQRDKEARQLTVN